MLLFRSSVFQSLRATSLGVLFASLNLVLASASSAQVSDVVKPAADGDFTVISIQGFRGTYLQRYWLVVDRDPRGLLCRDERGHAHVALKYGSVIETDLSPASTAPLSIQWQKSYVRVRVQPMHLLYDARLKQRGSATICNVRANSSFIAPVNSESIRILCKPEDLVEAKPSPPAPRHSESREPASGITP